MHGSARAEEVAHMNPVSRVRQSYALRLATGGVLLLALVLAPGLGGRFGPTPGLPCVLARQVSACSNCAITRLPMVIVRASGDTPYRSTP